MKLTTKPGYLNATYCSNFLYWENETLNVRLFKWNPQEMERSSLIVFVKIIFFLLSYFLGLFFRSTNSYDKCLSFFCLFVVMKPLCKNPKQFQTQHNDQTIFLIPPSFLHKRFARKGWVHKKKIFCKALKDKSKEDLATRKKTIRTVNIENSIRLFCINGFTRLVKF